MRTLYLLRHAKSSWARPLLRDHDRPLARRGQAASRAIADYIAGSHPLPDLVISSTAVRTVQTARLVVARWQPRPPVVEDASLYLGTPGAMLSCIQAVEGAPALMLIGHNPGTAELGCLLAGDRDALGGKFPTAGLAVLTFAVDDWAAAAPGAGHLLAFVQPRSLDARPG